jgi:large subunit ribosomal protein L9
MQVILTQDVKSVGKKGQLVEVSEGYGTNFLLPKKLAMIATKSNINELKLKEESEAHKREVELLQAQELGEKLKATTVEIKAKLGENGKLFGSITNKEIGLELEKQYAIKIDKKKIVLEDSIKTLGVHGVVIKLHAKVAVKLNVKISELK